MANELTTIDGYCTVTKTSLSFKREVSKDEWQTVFDACRHVEGCIQFWIGDLLSYRDQKWGMYDDIAEETGIEKNTLRQYKQVAETIKSDDRSSDLSFTHHLQVSPLEPEKQKKILQKASENKWTVRETREAVRSVKRGDEDRKKIEMPEDVFDVVYIDPPWQYSNSGFEMSAENKYPTMSIKEMIDQVKFKTSENAVMFMWVTNPLLEESFELINGFGFKYKTCFVWTKQRHTAGFYVFGQHELLMICVKGSGMLPEKKFKSIITGYNSVHSKKPHSVYETIEEMYPNRKYLEVFARNNRNGWTSWGNECEK